MCVGEVIPTAFAWATLIPDVENVPTIKRNEGIGANYREGKDVATPIAI